MFGALKRGFRSTASLIHVLVRNVVGVLQPKRILAASRGFLAAARLSCYNKDWIRLEKRTAAATLECLVDNIRLLDAECEVASECDA